MVNLPQTEYNPQIFYKQNTFHRYSIVSEPFKSILWIEDVPRVIHRQNTFHRIFMSSTFQEHSKHIKETEGLPREIHRPNTIHRSFINRIPSKGQFQHFPKAFMYNFQQVSTLSRPSTDISQIEPLSHVIHKK